MPRRSSDDRTLQSVRRAYIEIVLRGTDYDLDKAASLLALSRASLQRLMTRLGIADRPLRHLPNSGADPEPPNSEKTK